MSCGTGRERLLFSHRVSSLSPAAAAPAADWPLFRGNPLQTGVAVSSELPEKLDILWKFTAKDGFEATAGIVKGVVYVGCQDEHLYALDLATGKPEVEVQDQGGRSRSAAEPSAATAGLRRRRRRHTSLRRRRGPARNAGRSRPTARSPPAPTSPATRSCSARRRERSIA